LATETPPELSSVWPGAIPGLQLSTV
jgi:hypothetical protein